MSIPKELDPDEVDEAVDKTRLADTPKIEPIKAAAAIDFVSLGTGASAHSV